MNKKLILAIVFFFFIDMCLFSIPQLSEDIFLANLTNTELIVKFEYNKSPEDFQIQTINDIDINIGYFRKNNELILAPNKRLTIIYYTPVIYSFINTNKLREIPAFEKVKTIFKSFSIQSTDGKFIVKDIDDLNDSVVVTRKGMSGLSGHTIEIREDLLLSAVDG